MCWFGEARCGRGFARLFLKSFFVKEFENVVLEVECVRKRFSANPLTKLWMEVPLSTTNLTSDYL